MNIALSTLVLFFFLLPGIIFRRTYYSEEFSKEYFRSSFFGIFISTFIPSLLFHVIWFFISSFTPNGVDLLILFDLASENTKSTSYANIEINSKLIVFYNFSMLISSFIAGYLAKKIIRYNKIDRKNKQLRFQNSWHYILTGEFFDFPRANFTLEQDTVEEIEFVFADLLIETNNQTYLYDGVLVDYELSKSGGLDTVTLKNVQRRLLSDDSEFTEKGIKKDNSIKYYPLDGHILLFKYNLVINMNFSYYKFRYNTETEEYTPTLVE
jgi:hypothetical protein